MRDAVASLRPQPSIDETPLDLTYLGTHYRIPRNYIVSLSSWNGPEQNYIGLRVNIPDLKPFEPATAACFLARPSDRPAGCQPLEFRIQSVGVPDADQVSQNNHRYFNSQIGIADPSGMELYESGPESARRNLYRVTTLDGHFLYSCILSVNDFKHAVCSVVADRTKHGPNLNYFFPVRYLSVISAIDEELRHLVDGFVVTQ